MKIRLYKRVKLSPRPLAKTEFGTGVAPEDDDYHTCEYYEDIDVTIGFDYSNNEVMLMLHY